MYKIKTRLPTFCILTLLSLSLVACLKADTTPLTTTTSPTINESAKIADQITNHDTSNHLTQDIKFPLKEYNGQLGLQADFNFEHLSHISLLSLSETTSQKKAAEPIILDEQYTQYIRQNLFWLNLDSSKVASHFSTTHPILITLFINDEEYELIYELDINAYKIGDEYYYADHQVTKMMNLYFDPQSKLSKIATLEQLYATEAENTDNTALYNYESRYEFEQFEISNLDYHGWYKLVSEHPDTKQMGLEFNIAINSLSPLLYNAKLDILFSHAIYFFSDQFETIDGIKVGLTKEEVLELLGQPNFETSVSWSYFIGDYLKFHLYFVDNQIEVIFLTLPV